MAKGDKGKFSKRGGKGSGSSRFHAVSAEEIEQRNNRIAEFDAVRSKRRTGEDGEGDDEEEDGSGEEEEEEDEEEQLQDKEVGKDTDLVAKVDSKLKIVDIVDGEEEIKLGEASEGDPVRTMSRKEREQAEKEKAAEDYRRRHELGLTDEYKRDMAKLEEVKKRREAAAQRALEEKEIKDTAEKEARERALKMGLLNDGDSDSEESVNDEKKKKKSNTAIPKLDKITIKKMKPTQLKEALKVRNLDIQGNAKELTDRLLDYEAARSSK